MILWWTWRRWKVFRTIKIRQKAKCSNVCTYPAWQLINTIHLYVKVDSSNMTQKLRTRHILCEMIEKFNLKNKDKHKLNYHAILSVICKCWHKKCKCFTAATTYPFHPSVTRRQDKDIELQVLSMMFFRTKIIWLANCLIFIIYSPISFYFLSVFLCTH